MIPRDHRYPLPLLIEVYGIILQPGEVEGGGVQRFEFFVKSCFLDRGALDLRPQTGGACGSSVLALDDRRPDGLRFWFHVL